MRNDKEQAIVMRQGGLTYSQIKDRMGVPRSTLSSWFREQQWSNDIAIQNARKANNSTGMRLVVLNSVRGGRLKKIYEDAKQDAFADFHELKYHPLFIAGVMAYWAHGDRSTKTRVSITSMDPKLVRIFRLFIEHVCRVSKFKAQLMLKADFEREPEIRLFWQEQAGFTHDRFLKTLTIGENKPANKAYFGVCNLMVNSAYLKNKILRWIELLAEDIGQEKYLIDNAGIV